MKLEMNLGDIWIMGKILFITGNFIPMASANGICIYNIIKELLEKGHKVYCICAKEDGQVPYEVLDSIHIYRVKKTLYSRLENLRHCRPRKIGLNILVAIYKYLRKVKLLCLLPLFPDISPYRTYKIFKIFENIHKKEHIDCIIGAFRPYEGVKAALKAKLKYPELVSIAYYLDLIRGAAPPKPLTRKMYVQLCYRNEVEEFSILDAVLLPSSGKDMYMSSEYNFAANKIQYVDFPLFTLPKFCQEQHSNLYEGHYLNIVYAGTIDLINRNPQYFLRLLTMLYLEGLKVKFHIYGNNQCHQIIEWYQKNYPGLIEHHGLVDYSYVAKCISDADFVVNISNKLSKDMVPSKIFQLFASGKPIINIINSGVDQSLCYFKRYPLVCYINEYNENLERDSMLLMNFLKSKKGLMINLHDIKDIYETNTPKYAAAIFESIINFSN